MAAVIAARDRVRVIDDAGNRTDAHRIRGRRFALDARSSTGQGEESSQRALCPSAAGAPGAREAHLPPCSRLTFMHAIIAPRVYFDALRIHVVVAAAQGVAVGSVTTLAVAPAGV